MTTRKSTWITYATYGYTHDVGNDQRSAGGVHHHQVRKHAKYGWQKRIAQTNGRYTTYGRVEALDELTGEAHFATAQQLNLV